MNKFCSVLFHIVPFYMFMKRPDTNGWTYNDSIVSQVINTILTKDFKNVLTYDINGNKSGWVGLLQEEESFSPRLGRRCLPGDTHSPSNICGWTFLILDKTEFFLPTIELSDPYSIQLHHRASLPLKLIMQSHAPVNCNHSHKPQTFRSSMALWDDTGLKAWHISSAMSPAL